MQRVFTIFALGMHFDEDFLGAHHFDYLPDIGSRLLKQAELFPK